MRITLSMIAVLILASIALYLYQDMEHEADLEFDRIQYQAKRGATIPKYKHQTVNNGDTLKYTTIYTREIPLKIGGKGSFEIKGEVYRRVKSEETLIESVEGILHYTKPGKREGVVWHRLVFIE